jgi:hypothetical protein
MSLKEFAAPIELHAELNPRLWHEGKLRPEVKRSLIKIAQDFYRYIGIKFTVKDLVVAGSNAAYTYTEHSDLDLHLIADFDTVSCDREAAELFDTKRLLYKEEYTLKIRGIPVELYVEDQRHPAVSASYSLLTDHWIREPVKDIPPHDMSQVEELAQSWRNLIKQAMKTGNLTACRASLGLLRRYRKLGLKNPAGEFSVENLVYKSLRNDSTIKGIVKLINRLHDTELSISQQ